MCRMKSWIALWCVCCAFSSAFAGSGTTLREAFRDKFLIGAALNVRQVVSKDEALQSLIREQFSSVVAENCMKAEEVQPEEGHFDFTDGYRLCDLAEKNGQVVIGHCLIWHSQAPKWFFKDKDGNTVSKEVLIQRMKDHIYKVVGHYKGRVKGWDVVNEAIEGNGEFRKSPFYKIIGPEFIRLAFQFAHEADPDVEEGKTAVPIAGEVPSILNRPKGCPFHDRCSRATDRCRQEVPKLLDKGNGHQVACFLYQ